ncbi:TIR domain-containing protein [Streptomyces sp. NBC_00028]|uniref:nSTAND1 domain-containing NTPase n=1 Tax=Streptomyces sp. NBC_00028 TaxID=2975624 RepID=UPI00324F0DF8
MGRVFISYHADDGADTAHRLVEALRTAGYEDCFAYALPGHGITASYPWRDELRRNLLAAEALVVVTTEGSAAEWCVWEVSVFRERKPMAPVVECRVDGAAGRALIDTLQALKVEPDDPRSMADAERAILKRLDEGGVSRTAALTAIFPGLNPFQEEHARVFFGRDEDIDALSRPLLGRRRNGALAVIGPSGAGKSSLVRAGLVPALRGRPPTSDGDTPFWIVLGPVTPARGGLAALAHAIAEVRRDLGLDTDTGPSVLQRLRERPEGLAETLDGVAAHVPDARLLVIVDQAEELLLPEADTDAALLVAALAEAVRRNTWLVYTVRADFLDALMRFEAFEPLLRDHHLVKPLARSELPRIVNAPLDTLGWRLDDQALGLIQEDAAGEALPLLAFALQQLWQKVNPDGKRPPREITRGEYEASGRVQKVLTDQAEEAFRLARDFLTDSERSTVRDAERAVLKALGRLVSVDESGKYTRRPVALRDLPERELRLLRPFVECRVLTTVRHPVESARSGAAGWERFTEDAFEVAHESLFVHWPRLRENLERDHDALRARREIEETAVDWARYGRQPDQLIPASRLMRLVSVLSGRTEEAFTAAWPELYGTLTDLHLSGAALDLVAQSLQRTADDEVRRGELLVESDPRAVLRLLAGDGSAQGDLLLGLLLYAPDLDGWRHLLRRAMAAHPQLRCYRAQEAGLWGVAWSPDDTLLVTASKDGCVRVLDAETGLVRATFRHAREARGDGPGWVRSVDWSPDGELIASVATDETLRLWSWPAGDEVRVVPLDDRPWSVRFSPDGRYVLVACADGTARVWETRGRGREPVRTCVSVDGEGRAVRLWDADIAADGRVATAREDGVIDVHWVDGGVEQDGARGKPMRAVRFSPTHLVWLASGGQDNQVRVHLVGPRYWRTEHTLGGHTDQVRRVAWSPSGNRLASAGADATVRVWHAHDAQELDMNVGHAQGVCDVAWAHRGDRLASASDDGTVRIWRTTPERVQANDTFEPVQHVTWSQESRRLLMLVDDVEKDVAGTVLGYEKDDARWGTRVLKVGAMGEPDAVHWSSDGALCATVGSGGGKVSLWKTRMDPLPSTLVRLHLIAVLTDAHDTVADARWSVDGEWLAVVSRDRTWLPRLYDREGTLRPTPPGWTRHASFLSAVDWHPRCTEFAVAGQDNLVTVNTLDATVAEYRGDKVFTALAWHPEGAALAVGCTDGTVLVLDRGEEGLVARLSLAGHRQEVYSLAWSPDGTLLLSGSQDATAQLWDVTAGGRVTVLDHQDAAVRQVLWMDGSRLVLTRTGTGELYSWDISDALTRPQCGPVATDIAPLITEARLRSS